MREMEASGTNEFLPSHGFREWAHSLQPGRWVSGPNTTSYKNIVVFEMMLKSGVGRPPLHRRRVNFLGDRADAKKTENNKNN